MSLSQSTTERQIQAVLSPETAKRLDDYQFEKRIRSRPDAIRQVVEAGLDAIEAKEKAATAT